MVSRLLSIGVMILLALPPCWGQESRKPNVILIEVCTFCAPYLGCYGGEGVVSPSIDRLATDSIVFENAVAAASWTLPTTFSILTGFYPSVHGVNYQQSPGEEDDVRALRVSDNIPMIGEYFSQAGYHTRGCYTIAHAAPFLGTDRGFDVYDFARYQDAVGHVVSWLKKRESSEDNRPFFFYTLLTQCHSPYHPALEEYYSDCLSRANALIEAGTPSQLKDENIRTLKEAYRHSIFVLDQELYRLFDQLKQMNLYDDTVIVLVGDHGEMFGEHRGLLNHGYYLYDSLLHVPLIIKSPHSQYTGRVSDVVSQVDILPTLLEFIGSEPSPYLQGRSLVPLIKDEGLDPEPVFAELREGMPHTTAIRTQTHKMIQTRDGEYFLYDMTRDGDSKEVGSDEPEVVADLKRELQTHRETCDLLRKDFSPGADDLVKTDPESVESLRAMGYLK